MLLSYIHRHRYAFFFINAMLILGFAAPGAVAPEAFWGWLGVPVKQPMFVRLAAWYLISIGFGALLIAREPESNIPLIWLLGVEKAGAVTILGTYLGGDLRPQLAVVLIVDAILSVLLLVYARAAPGLDSSASARSRNA